MCFVVGGLFERSHYLMGFEDALCNYMLNQDVIYDLLGAIADWKIGHFVPCVPGIVPLFSEVERVYNEELSSYGKNYFRR